ncbi:unnamed protein product [Parajaminaea phylloscopi]
MMAFLSLAAQTNHTAGTRLGTPSLYTKTSQSPPLSADEFRNRPSSAGTAVQTQTKAGTSAKRAATDNKPRTIDSSVQHATQRPDLRHPTSDVERRLARVDINRRDAAYGVDDQIHDAAQSSSRRFDEHGGQRAREGSNIDQKEDHGARDESHQSPPEPSKPPAIDVGKLGIGTLPKAAILQKWRDAAQIPPIPERELLRDILYLIQGINGHHVRFEQVASPEATHDPGVIRMEPQQADDPAIRVRFVESSAGKIALPVRQLIHRLAEAGKHYMRITAFTKAQRIREQTGRIMQSLCRFLEEEVASYYELICYLEALYNEGPPEEEEVTRPAGGPSRALRELPGNDTRGLTLKRVLVLVEPSVLRLRLMSSLVEGAQHTHGGALVSLIHSYTFNGDPLIRSLTERLLDNVSQSFFGSLSRWIYEGELHDPFKEFFVEVNPKVSDSGLQHHATASAPITLAASQEDDAAAIWETKYVFRSELVPSFLTENFARKIFSAGKSLNFIRHSCSVSDWEEARSAVLQTTCSAVATPATADSSSPPVLQYRDLTGLERTIDSVHSTVSKRLLDILLDKFKLQQHLRAINDYLLLTRGDFSEILMESLSPILHKPASTLYRHSLSGALETAIRSSNAQFDDDDILRRLDARVLEFSGSETGWDTFTLEYRVDSPVNTVLDANAMAEYQQVFQHLWRMKRVEGSLSSSCMKLMGASNALNKAAFDGVKGKKRREVVKDEDIEALKHESHRSLLVLSAMTHFIRQLQGYNQLEVISYSWQDLEAFFEKRHGDLDVLIAAHRSYLSSLHGKVLLRGRGSGSKQRGSSDMLASELRANFDAILRFSAAADQLATFILDFLQRRELLNSPLSGDVADEEAENRRAEEAGAATTRRLAPVLRSLSDASVDFKERTEGIITRLERHGNLVIRDLSVRLDFNGFYNRTRPATPSSARYI